MNVFHKVTLESLKKNKTRTVVTIIGIILSAAMMMAVTTLVSSLQNYMVQNTIYNNGDWHGSALNIDDSVLQYFETGKTEDEDLKEAYSAIDSYVYSQQIGYAYAEGCTNEAKPYLFVLGANNNFFESMPVHLIAGRLPQKSDEIILPEHLADNGDVYYKLGDIITLEIGERASDGYTLKQKNPYQGELETLEVQETRTYTVVGFYERPSFEDYSAPGYTALTVMDKVSPEGACYNVYYKMENPNDVYEIFNYLICEGDINSGVLTYLGVSGYVGFYTVLYGLAAVVIGLIMFGSVSLIYNAFSISVSERTKQFGLLSSIGATKKQLRKMVFFEAGVVSIIGVPLGILAGIGGIGVTFHFIGKAFSNLTSYPIPLTLSVSPWAIVAACIITLVTVFISAWIPSKRATMVTAVEAIRQSKDVKLSKKEKKKLAKAQKEETTAKTTFGEKWIYRFFGLPGMIADKYYKRSRKKYRTTVVSLFMSIVLFVSASALTSYLTDTMESGFEGDQYDIRYVYHQTEYLSEEEIEAQDFSDVIAPRELSALFKEAEGVTDAAYVNRRIKHINIENQFLSDDYLTYYKELKEYYEGIGEGLTEGNMQISLDIVFVEDEEFEVYLEEQNLDKDMYTNQDQPLAIVFDGNTAFDYTLEKYVTKKVLKSADAEIVLNDEENSVTLKCGEIFYERPYFIEDTCDLVYVYPNSMKNVVLQDGSDRNYTYYYYILTDDHEASAQDMKDIVVKNGLSKYYLHDKVEALEENRTLIMIINVFANGFIVLISLIAAANVFNTISTNIGLRRKEFAMLKSVGMSNKEMNRMMNFECLLYGSRALLYGIPVSVVITWIIYRIVSEGYSAGFYLPWGAIGIAVLSVFIVVFATMMYSMRKIKKDNVIEALKEENI